MSFSKKTFPDFFEPPMKINPFSNSNKALYIFY